jgi:hypothetical protein
MVAAPTPAIAQRKDYQRRDLSDPFQSEAPHGQPSAIDQQLASAFGPEKVVTLKQDISRLHTKRQIGAQRIGFDSRLAKRTGSASGIDRKNCSV